MPEPWQVVEVLKSVEGSCLRALSYIVIHAKRDIARRNAISLWGAEEEGPNGKGAKSRPNWRDRPAVQVILEIRDRIDDYKARVAECRRVQKEMAGEDLAKAMLAEAALLKQQDSLLAKLAEAVATYDADLQKDKTQMVGFIGSALDRAARAKKPMDTSNMTDAELIAMASAEKAERNVDD